MRGQVLERPLDPLAWPATRYQTRLQARDRKISQTFEAPCYTIKQRTRLNYVASFPLRTEDDRSVWTLRGVALVCSVD